MLLSPFKQICQNPTAVGAEDAAALCARAAYSPRPDSGESKRPADKDPSRWGVEEVVWFIKDADPQALGPHADAFRKHVSPAAVSGRADGGFAVCRLGQRGKKSLEKLSVHI